MKPPPPLGGINELARDGLTNKSKNEEGRTQMQVTQRVFNLRIHLNSRYSVTKRIHSNIWVLWSSFTFKRLLALLRICERGDREREGTDEKMGGGRASMIDN